jgi:hypothetical protein
VAQNTTGSKVLASETQVRKFLPQNWRRVRLDLANKFRRRPTRIGLDKQMHAIRHHFKRVDLHVTQRCRFVNHSARRYDLSVPDGYLRHQTTWYLRLKTAPAFLAYRASVPPMPGYILATHITSKRRRFRCRLPPTVPAAKMLMRRSEIEDRRRRRETACQGADGEQQGRAPFVIRG